MFNFISPDILSEACPTFCLSYFSSIPFIYLPFIHFFTQLRIHSYMYLQFPLIFLSILPHNPQVTLARVARERRHIRNNLPLRGVLVIAANKDDIEALEYLKGDSISLLDVTSYHIIS